LFVISRGLASLALVYSWMLMGVVIAPEAGGSWSALYEEVTSGDMTIQIWVKGMFFATPWLVYSLCCDTGFFVSMAACTPFFVFPYLGLIGFVSRVLRGEKDVTMRILAITALLTACGTVLLFYFAQRLGGIEE
jgi:hypothetical protein